MTDGDTWMDTKHGDRLIRPPMSIPLTDLELMFYGLDGRRMCHQKL